MRAQLRPTECGLAIAATAVAVGLIVLRRLDFDNSGDNDETPCVAALSGKNRAEKKGEGGVSGAVKGVGEMLDSMFK